MDVIVAIDKIWLGPQFKKQRNCRVDVCLYEADYNVHLGANHLAELRYMFNGSYILTTVAYNSGTIWMWDWGWRNTAIRVLEATQIYRARLNSGVMDVKLSEDLR